MDQKWGVGKMTAVSRGNPRSAGFNAGMGSGGQAVGGKPARAVKLKGMSVKTTLRLAFAVLLVGTLLIGVFSLAQIGRLNASAQSIYDQGHIASRAAEEARGHMLRASRAQKMLLTATTARERDELGADIDHALACSGSGAIEQKVGDRPQQHILHLLPLRPALAARPVPIGNLVGVLFVAFWAIHRCSSCCVLCRVPITRRRHVTCDYVRFAARATKFVRQRSISRWANSGHSLVSLS